MSEEKSLLIRKRRVVAFSGRGPIYNWLRAHRDLVAAKLVTGEATWAALCAEMIRHGVGGARGEAPTADAAAKVWQRVCRDAVETAETVPARRLLPSRLPKDWQPTLVEPPSPGRASAPVPVRAAVSGPTLAPAVVSGRSYAPKVIADEDLDLSLAPETYKNPAGEIVPMPLEARQRLARFKMQMRAEDEEKFRFGGG